MGSQDHSRDRLLKQTMNENVRDDRQGVYEISYLLAGLPEEKVAAESASLTKIVTTAGGVVIAEEAPRHEHLAYTMRKKTVSGAYDKYDSAHFGWVKFEMNSNKIEGVKKAIEVVPAVLRILVTTTVKENTYLGKRAPAIAEAFGKKPMAEGDVAEKKIADPVAPVSVEEMDKSIDDLVKEV